MDETFNMEFELEEWSRVNRLLRQHGLPAVELDTSSASFHAGGVPFGADLSQRLRKNLHSLIDDVNRRQALVQELIQTNNQLREELSAQTCVSESYESRSRDLRAMLENSKSKIEALEQEMLEASRSKDSSEEKAQNTNVEIKARVKELQRQCRAHREETERLRLKLQRMTQEEERRVQKQNQVLQGLRGKTTRGLDDKILDVVASYEKQMDELRRELQQYRAKAPHENAENSDVTPQATPQATSQYKALIRAYEKEIKEGKKKQKSLENDVSLLQLELQGRPELKDLRDCQSKLKKLERIVKKHNLMEIEDRLEKMEKKKYSTQVDDIDYLPLPHCRSYLKIICNHLGVFDLEHVSPKLEKTAKAEEAFPRLEQFAKQVMRVVETEGVTRPPVGRVVSATSHEVWCERSWQHALPTLQHWVAQLQHLKALQASINKLSITLLPWRNIRVTEDPPTVTKLIEAVDAIVYEETPEDNSKQPQRAERTKEQASRAMLQGIVEHFMNLFDVSKLTGCYARMNDVYAKLGETHNVLKTLRDLLGLGKECKSALVVDSVARLCELQTVTAHAQLKQLLQQDDVDSVVRKLKVYDEFFPVFHDIMTRLMDVTTVGFCLHSASFRQVLVYLLVVDVSRIDQVVPAVKALKMLLDAR